MIESVPTEILIANAKGADVFATMLIKKLTDVLESVQKLDVPEKEKVPAYSMLTVTVKAIEQLVGDFESIRDAAIARSENN